jgi:hypothetical protein
MNGAKLIMNPFKHHLSKCKGNGQIAPPLRDTPGHVRSVFSIRSELEVSILGSER